MPLFDSGCTRAEENAARAALVVALLLWCVVVFPWPSHFLRCGTPHETVSWQGWTVGVGCGGTALSAGTVRGPARLLFGEKLDLNSVNVRALEVLPGIGPARARKIVALRVRRTLESVADIGEIAGIGPKTIEGLRGSAQVGSKEQESR